MGTSWYSTHASVLFFGQGGRTYELSRRLNLIINVFSFQAAFEAGLIFQRRELEWSLEVYKLQQVQEGHCYLWLGLQEASMRRSVPLLVTVVSIGLFTSGGDGQRPGGDFLLVKYCGLLWGFFCINVLTLWQGQDRLLLSEGQPMRGDTRHITLSAVSPQSLLCLENFFRNWRTLKAHALTVLRTWMVLLELGV